MRLSPTIESSRRNEKTQTFHRRADLVLEEGEIVVVECRLPGARCLGGCNNVLPTRRPRMRAYLEAERLGQPVDGLLIVLVEVLEADRNDGDMRLARQA